jgi:DNA polymerase III delta subunit
MARKSTTSTETSAKKPQKVVEGPLRVFLLVGAEAGRKQAEAEKLLRANTDPDFADFDSEMVDGNSTLADRILSGVAMVPMGERSRVVLVRDTQQMEPEEQKKLAAGLEQIPASGVLILHTGTPITEDGKVKKGTTIEITLSNAVKKVGEVREFAIPKSDDVRGWLVQEAKTQWHKTLSGDALGILAQLPGEDLNRVRNELAKAALHAGGAPQISAVDVEATLTRTPDDVIFKLCDAIGSRKIREALGYVSVIFQGGGRPDSIAPRVSVMIARQLRLVAQFRYLGEKRMVGRGATPPSAEVLAMFPGDGAGSILNNPRMSWMADKYVAQARNYTSAELTERLEKVFHADLQFKGIKPGGDSHQAVLQRLVIEICE